MALFSLGLSVIQKNKQEEVLNTLETKVEERTSELKNTNIELENMQSERSIFFASLSHELRTPLNAILGFSKILHASLKDVEKKEYIKKKKDKNIRT